MILEGNLLTGILIIAALAIAVLLVYIRFAFKKEPTEAPSLFSRLLKFGSKDEADPSGYESAEEDETGQPESAIGGGMSLRMPGFGRKKEAEPAAAEEKKESLSVGGMLSGLFARKTKDEIKDEVRAIDNQLNNVLRETEEINVTGIRPEIGATDLSFSDGRGMRELDLEMGTINDLSMMSREDLRLMPTTPEPEITLAPPVREPPKEEEMALTQADQRKPDAQQAPVEAAPMKKPEAADPMKPPEADFMQMPGDIAGGKKEIGDDLLSSLEAAAHQEVAIDMTIMKEYQDMPITCVELESELKGILDQITINMQGKRNQEA